MAAAAGDAQQGKRYGQDGRKVDAHRQQVAGAACDV
jgi:hypothetical protein